MKIKFTDNEINDMKNIIEEYRIVSKKIYDFQKKAEEIQDNVIELETKLKYIKDKEDHMMNELHSKYGQFSIQDIYESIYGRRF